jgi:NAD(P)-dependent dehydrogenase (short-subunit alcohol dehydrogenase family)
VVVTGAGRGMGAGIATAIVQAGGRVALIDVIRGSAAATATRLDPSGERAVGLTGDVSSDDDIDLALTIAVDRFGAVDGWVNNAGVIEMAPASDTTRESFDRHLSVNTTAVLRCCQAVAQNWRAAGRGGAIVNIASYAGKAGYPDMIAYNVSKAAVINLTRNLAHEWARDGINVNCICLGRTITPLEIGRVVVFLLSDDARVIRGQAISVDGGESPY